MIRILIADDEAPARQRLHAQLQGMSDVEVVGDASDGGMAVAMIEELEPDLVFLDIQMPELDGFDVVERIGTDRMPGVVFVTAYDEYALRAFEVGAIDYLLKPYDTERFRTTFERARARLTAGAQTDLSNLLIAMGRARGVADRLPIRDGARIQMIETSAIEYVSGENNYVRVHVGGKSYLLRETLSSIEARLDPTRFVRVHRSLIVNSHHVAELEPLFQGEYVLRLKGGARLTSGRTYRQRVRDAFGLQGGRMPPG